MSDDSKDPPITRPSGDQPPEPKPKTPFQRAMEDRQYEFWRRALPGGSGRLPIAPGPGEPGYSEDLRKDIASAADKAETSKQTPTMPVEPSHNHKGGKSFSLSRDDALFWIGVAVFGDGLYLMADHPAYGIPLILAGVALLVWANRGHMPKPPLRLAVLVLAMIVTCGVSGYDLYDRHFGSAPPAAPHLATGKLWSPLTDNQEASLERALRAISKRAPMQIICMSADCRELAGNLISAFNGAEWQVSGTFSGFASEPVGVVLYQTDINDHSLKDAIETTTRLKVQRIEASAFPNTNSVFIGIRP